RDACTASSNWASISVRDVGIASAELRFRFPIKDQRDWRGGCFHQLVDQEPGVTRDRILGPECHLPVGSGNGCTTIWNMPDSSGTGDRKSTRLNSSHVSISY